MTCIERIKPNKPRTKFIEKKNYTWFNFEAFEASQLQIFQFVAIESSYTATNRSSLGVTVNVIKRYNWITFSILILSLSTEQKLYQFHVRREICQNVVVIITKNVRYESTKCFDIDAEWRQM